MGVIGRAINLIFKPESDLFKNDIRTDEVYANGADTPYGKKLANSDEEKSSLVECLISQELDVFLLLIAGFTSKETARQLGIRHSTANAYKMAIFRKLHVSSCAELIINYRGVYESIKK